jgi:SAM-dependent methyltransferase
MSAKDTFYKWGRLVNRFTFGWFRNRHFVALRDYPGYLRDYRKYKKLPGGDRATFFDLQPVLGEKTAITDVNYYYFYQDTWCAGEVFKHKPKEHVDVGSTALLVGILSQFTHVTSIDVRPLDVTLPNLTCREGSATEMPFRDNSIESLSSICVIEHIGLGRYGDPLDPGGSERAIAEFERVLAPKGHLYVSVPVNDKEKVGFNANRYFEAQAFIERFKKLKLVDAHYVQGKGIYPADKLPELNQKKEMCGLFHFTKI